MARTADTRAPVTWLRLDAADCYRTLTVTWREDTYFSRSAIPGDG